MNADSTTESATLVISGPLYKEINRIAGDLGYSFSDTANDVLYDGLYNLNEVIKIIQEKLRILCNICRHNYQKDISRHIAILKKENKGRNDYTDSDDSYQSAREWRHWREFITELIDLLEENLKEGEHVATAPQHKH